MNDVTARYIQIITQLIDNNKIKDWKDFALKIGVSVSSITEITKGRSNVGLKAIQKTISTFPGINTEWLITGEGEIFKTKTPENLINSNDKIFDKEFDKERKLQKTLSIAHCPDNNETSLAIVSDREASYVTEENPGTIIPIVDISAAAGAGALNPDYYTQTDSIVLPPHMVKKGLHHCIRVKGQSMSPTLQDGGYIITRLLNPSDWIRIKDGYIYVVTNRDGETFIKRLKNRLKEHGFLVCTSDNPEKATFPNFNIMEDEIHNVWAVEWYLSAKMPNIHETYYSKLQHLEEDMENMKTTMQTILKKMS